MKVQKLIQQCGLEGYNFEPIFPIYSYKNNPHCSDEFLYTCLQKEGDNNCRWVGKTISAMIEHFRGDHHWRMNRFQDYCCGNLFFTRSQVCF